MLQRIQTVYLILAIFCLLSIFLFPVTSDAKFEYLIHFQAVIALLIGQITFNIFQFKNLKLQLKLTLTSILFSIGLIVGFVLLVPAPELGVYITFPAPLFLFLAHRGIKKDYDLLQSLNRLR